MHNNRNNSNTANECLSNAELYTEIFVRMKDLKCYYNKIISDIKTICITERTI